MYVPDKIFLTKGAGRHREKLASFEMALRNAKIEHFNLVRVSSIFPPECKLIPRARGLKVLRAGQIVHCVLSVNETNEPQRLLAASVGVAIPRDTEAYGYISEHHCFGKKGLEVGEYTEDLAAEMLATTHGVKFDPDAAYDEKREVWKIDGKIILSTNITQTAVGDRTGLWTTVLAAAMLIPSQVR